MNELYIHVVNKSHSIHHILIYSKYTYTIIKYHLFGLFYIQRT